MNLRSSWTVVYNKDILHWGPVYRCMHAACVWLLKGNQTKPLYTLARVQQAALILPSLTPTALEFQAWGARRGSGI